MWNKSKILLRQVSSLLENMNDSFGDRHWPAYVLSALEEQYHLTPKEMWRLWYIRRRMSKGKHAVDSLLIYDWVRASEKRISVRSSRDLYNNSDLLLFKGNMFGGRSVYLRRVSDCDNN